ncbi:hypothetical protein D3C81_1568700 [compost metagenome]
MVKLLHGFNQSHVSFLNQIQEQHAATDITLGDADDQTQIGFGQTAFRLFIPVFDPFGKLHLVVRRQQRYPPDLFQIHPYRVIDLDPRRKREVVIVVEIVALMRVVSIAAPVILVAVACYINAKIG